MSSNTIHLMKKSTPDLSCASTPHLEAIARGDDHWRLWQHNVEDRFKDKNNEEIRAELQASCFPYAVCFENWINDFNIATGARNANAFNTECIYYLGLKRLDRRGMLGTYHYTDVRWLPTLDDFLVLKQDYHVVGLDNVPGAKPLASHTWDSRTKTKTLLVFGSESVGLTEAMQQLCDELVYIEQFGSVRSLNCGVASGIVLNHFITQYRVTRNPSI